MSDDLKSRTKDFAVRIVRLYSALPKTTEGQVLGKQILRSGTSVGAQYRESRYAKSDADFVSKVQGSLQELEETMYWLELLEEMVIFQPEKLVAIKQEANELRVYIDHDRKESQSSCCLINFFHFILCPLSFILYMAPGPAQGLSCESR